MFKPEIIECHFVGFFIWYIKKFNGKMGFETYSNALL